VRYSTTDPRLKPPRIEFPARYNAATDLVERHVEQGHGGRIAFQDDERRCTYGELLEQVNRAGNALRALGVRAEDRVLLVMLDTIDFACAFLGAMKIGAVPVPLNTLFPPKDYEGIVLDSRARVIVASDVLVPKLETAVHLSPHVARVLVSRSPGGAYDGPHARWDDALAAESTELGPEDTGPDDVAFWLYSSGSTGRPKGAMHLHSHLMTTSVLYAQAVLGIKSTDVVYSAAKLFFAYGLGNSLTFPLSVGAHAVLTAERPTPAHVRAVLHKHQPTIFCGVPTLFASMLADETLGPATASRELRVSTSAGEALPRHIGEKWRARFGSEILDGIGSTEMLHIFLSNHPGDVRYGTSGKPVGGYDLKLVGDDGEPVPAGEEGSLWVNGPTAAVGYFRDRARSLSTFHGPWTRTGDRYMRDADGYYTYGGRSDDMLKVGGIWVSPFEVESALAAHDAVLEAAVVGHEDDDGLTKPKAFVVLKDADAARKSSALVGELQAFVKGSLAPYKYPRWIEFVAELPKTPTGKIQRFKLRHG
jgi:benzoate-CoA ligase family protein